MDVNVKIKPDKKSLDQIEDVLNHILKTNNQIITDTRKNIADSAVQLSSKFNSILSRYSKSLGNIHKAHAQATRLAYQHGHAYAPVQLSPEEKSGLLSPSAKRREEATKSIRERINALNQFQDKIESFMSGIHTAFDDILSDFVKLRAQGKTNKEISASMSKKYGKGFASPDLIRDLNRLYGSIGIEKPKRRRHVSLRTRVNRSLIHALHSLEKSIHALPKHIERLPKTLPRAYKRGVKGVKSKMAAIPQFTKGTLQYTAGSMRGDVEKASAGHEAMMEAGGAALTGAVTAGIGVIADLLDKIINFVKDLAPVQKIMKVINGYFTLLFMPLGMFIMGLLMPLMVALFNEMNKVGWSKAINEGLKLGTMIGNILALAAPVLFRMGQAVVYVLAASLITIALILTGIALTFEAGYLMLKLMADGIGMLIKLLSGLGNSVVKGIGSLFKGLPKFATGGEVRQTGMAVVHKGEYVVPAHHTNTTNHHISINVNVQGGSTTNMGDIIASQIEKRLRALKGW